MRIFQFSFIWVIAICGLLSLLFMIGNLLVLGMHRFAEEPRRYVAEGDFHAGKTALERYGCGSCHVIPGIRSATGRVGPSLRRIDEQVYIAGVLANKPENLIRWIRHPKDVDPRTAMPDLGVTATDARDMAAYLYRQPTSPWEEFKMSMNLALD